MTDRQEQDQPRAVGDLERGGEIRGRWPWVEARVWTERMLEALERGVKGGKWHSLIDKVHRGDNLQAAWHEVHKRKGCGGVDKVSLHQFEHHLEQRLEKLSTELQSGTYEPQSVLRTYIPKADGRGRRPLGIPTIADRVVQAALRNVIEPIFERKFIDQSYGFRPGRGCKDALREVARLLAEGHTWVVDVDIKSYFDSIPHEELIDEVANEIADGRVLDLIRRFLRQGVLEGMEQWQPEKGTPQGAVISPLLANIYLHPVDVIIRDAGFKMIRYADDMVIMCRTREEAEAALQALRSALEERQLELHPEKTGLVDATTRPGFQFLGYIFFGNKRYPRKSSEKKARRAVKERTKLNRSDDLDTIIRDVNSVLRGWFAFFKHSSRGAFTKLDQYVRYRLRAVLSRRKFRRSHRRRSGRGHDHYRWPNRFFADHGLFILSAEHAIVRQSYRR